MGFYRGGPVMMSALSGLDIALWDLKGESLRRVILVLIRLTVRTARKLGVPIYQLLGGKLRDKMRVYAWIGGDRPTDVEAQA